jgi:hypothetical protein
METKMNIFKKAAVAMAAVSMVASPVVAFAAPAVDVRAVSAVEGESEAGVSWALILLGLAAVVGLIVVVSDDDPSSP